MANNLTWHTSALATANTALDGTGTVATVLTAAAEVFVHSVRFMPAGPNKESIARIFVNNGSTNATPANNILVAEVAIPAGGDSNLGVDGVEKMLGFYIPNGYKINVTLGVTMTSGVYVACLSGDGYQPTYIPA